MLPWLSRFTKRLDTKPFVYIWVGLSGALTPLAFAPYRLYWLMPFLLGVLIFFAFRKAYPIRLAYLWGLSAYTAQIYWIHTALHTIAGLPNFYAIPLTLLLPSYLAIYPALCFWLLGFIRLPQSYRLLLAFPALWLISEWCRERALTGFGWGALGYSQVSESPLASLLPIGGVQLATLAVALISALLVSVILNKTRWQKIFALTGILSIIAITFILKGTLYTHPTGEKTTIGLGQGNIKQTMKWQPEYLVSTIELYYKQVATTQTDILILPETAIPLFEQHLPDGVISQFSETAKRNHTALALGISRFTEDGQGYLNSVINLSKFDLERPFNHPYYAKNHLVPFGEYIPLPKLTNWLYQHMDMPLSSFSQGGDHQTPLTLANQKVAFNICYEDSFGDDLIDSAKKATLLANVSNMAWYGDSNAMYQHLQQSQARAMELGRYMVRATNTGMTAIISPLGKIETGAKPNTQQVLIGTIKGYTGETPYMKYGSLPTFITSTIIVLILLLFSFFRKTQNIQKENNKE